MAGKGNRWLEWLEMSGNDWKLQEIAVCTWREIAGNGLICLEIS